MKFVVKEWKGRSFSFWIQKSRGALWIHFQGRTFVWEPPSAKKGSSRPKAAPAAPPSEEPGSGPELSAGPESAAQPPPEPEKALSSAPRPSPATRQSLREAEGGGRFLRAPVSGRIHKAPSQADEGRAVKKGELLFTLSSMKMEYSLAAPALGLIGKIKAQEGDAVQKGDPIMIFIPK